MWAEALAGAKGSVSMQAHAMCVRVLEGVWALKRAKDCVRKEGGEVLSGKAEREMVVRAGGRSSIVAARCTDSSQMSNKPLMVFY